MKKKLFAIFLLACCIGSSMGYGQVRGTYPKDKADLTLIRVNGVNKYDTLETVQVKNGKFAFSYVAKETGIYYLYFHDYDWSLPLLLENTETEIDIPDLKAIKIKGGDLQKELSAWKVKHKKLNKKWLELNGQIQGAADEKTKALLKEKQEKINHEMDALENRYIAANGDNMLGVFLIWQKGKINFLALDSKYKLLGKDMQNSVFGQEFKNIIAKDWRMTPGVTVPDFAIQDTSGVVRHLSEFDGKVKVIDFWASWCIPCRLANKRLMNLYEKYNKKGLEIISISVDENAAQWKKAIVKDKLVWTQLSQLKLKASSLYYQYKLNGVPTWILLDRNNKCVALGHVDDELEALIQKELNRK